jgi:hypothetical protein
VISCDCTAADACPQGRAGSEIRCSINKAGPITAAELMARGVSDDVEGRALDVVLRCGWPRPGDPLGIKPCIPIEMRELREVLKDAEDVINMTARVELLVTFLQRKLRTQEYVMALYVEAADARAGS